MKVTIGEFATKYDMNKADARAALSFLSKMGFAEAIPVASAKPGRPVLSYKMPAKGMLKIK